MATHSITNVAILASTTGSRAASGSTGNVAEGRQTVAAAIIEEQTRETEVTKEDLEKAVSHLKEYVQNMKRDMDFSVDDKTGRFVVKVYDSETRELIRQIPSEEMLAISRHLVETMEEEPGKGFLIELNA
ncbi:MAG TPA: flagellar protein FlaG [Gammaproteobacteria bacterium]|nr:flagellar protein FlaG [Gammaproteobacteria bacterium]